MYPYLKTNAGCVIRLLFLKKVATNAWLKHGALAMVTAKKLTTRLQRLYLSS